MLINNNNSSKLMHVIISVSLDPEILKKIEKNRGLVSRSVWITDIINKNLKKGDS